MARTIRRAALAAVAVAAYALAVRPRLVRFGATPDEVARRLPGDEIVPDPGSTTTMATTLPGPPAAVWPWLVQMGCNRAGWYSYDTLDNGGVPSATRIVPEWQQLAVGDRVPSVQTGETWFVVAELEPARALVYRASIDLGTREPFEPSGRWPRSFLDGTWAFVVEPGPDDTTRLIVRTRGHGRPRLALRAFDMFVGEPAHLVMQTRQFANLHRRVARPADVVDLAAEEAEERRRSALTTDPFDT